MPCDYSLYPPDWNVRRHRILERARHECEKCHVPNKAVIARFVGGVYGHLGNRVEWVSSGGKRSGDECARRGIGWNTSYHFPPTHAIPFQPGESISYDGRHWSMPAVRIVLTTAHLDRTGPPGPDDGPLDCPDDRLMALCQSCHLRLDAKRHLAKVARTRMDRRAARPLFELEKSPT